ncbi:MAG: MmcQ/YjbR family DNA-binding protein [Clostridia bacterium]|nr:MmcQ/YjbR family DNA-binding protein [Clostridia bacterium]
MSDREYLNEHIKKAYAALPEFPWVKYPGFAVYRHSENNKWFAVIMDIPKSKLGFQSEETVSVVNLKCDPVLMGSLYSEYGIFPAYHMNKSHWISVLLDGGVEKEKLEWLTDISFNLTKSKRR